MHKLLSFFLIILFAAGAAFAHGGKNHLLLGTVKQVHEDHLMVTSTDGHEVMVALTGTTQYEKDGKAAKRSDLVPGVRVSVRLTEDDKSAVKVKIGAVTAAAATQVTDPVCGMKVDPKTAPQSVYKGKTYYFCSQEDKAKFDKDPGAYLKQG